MTHPAYLLARLNPKNARFDIGSGGLPEMTPMDVAGGLAMVPRGLGRELLCRVWWPDGAALTAGELRGMLDGVMFGEWRRRADAMVTAQIRVATAGESTQRMRAATAASHQAREAMWPRISETYGRMRDAVILELVDPKHCADCRGRGTVAAGDLVRACAKCDGSGKTFRGPTWRADQMGMKHPSYLALWSEPYDWLMAICADELQKAERQLQQALDR